MFYFIFNIKNEFINKFPDRWWKVGGACWVRTGTSGSRVCCSSFCFRDVQGLNGFNSRVCMSLPIPSINRHLPSPNEGNVNSDSVLNIAAALPRAVPGLNLTLKSASVCSDSSLPPQSALGESPGGVRPAAASQTNPAPCFELAQRLTCLCSVLVLFLIDLTRGYVETGVSRGRVYLVARCDSWWAVGRTSPERGLNRVRLRACHFWHYSYVWILACQLSVQLPSLHFFHL